ncbi:hypothetical protein CEUSTIGMA_g7691.t1 [Chlamydomonas eustigma]|uniref:Reverse transcriptase domain-containing protein n=1 Tax=Chlamydomonas eustigma TaxID=1157962 RepID=A0A250XAW2_9CHLO|nr:hypothetical protein CEUSTIGMA_g7691.t1 [Chlamydomonas eustigma]|eukprot:GAX80253.1 hypothetical protein CEUSTIGMA_g7691.t1 [Chlamydomonas eustigma]
MRPALPALWSGGDTTTLISQLYGKPRQDVHRLKYVKAPSTRYKLYPQRAVESSELGSFAVFFNQLMARLLTGMRDPSIYKDGTYVVELEPSAPNFSTDYLMAAPFQSLGDHMELSLCLWNKWINPTLWIPMADPLLLKNCFASLGNLSLANGHDMEVDEHFLPCPPLPFTTAAKAKQEMHRLGRSDATSWRRVVSEASNARTGALSSQQIDLSPKGINQKKNSETISPIAPGPATPPTAVAFAPNTVKQTAAFSSTPPMRKRVHAKRSDPQAIQEVLQNTGYHVAVLTETQVTSDPSDLLRVKAGAGNIWPGVKLYHTPGRGKTAGVTIVISPNCNFLDDLVQVKNNVHDESGRILRIDFNMLGTTPSTLIGAYCPAKKEERDFFFSELLHSSLPPPGARQVLLAGDLNCVISEENDVFYPPGHPGLLGLRQGSSRLHGSAGLGRLMQEHNLVDIWRDQHPSDLTFTHWSKASNSGARLDRWLLSPRVLSLFERSWSQVLSSTAIQTDHLPAILSFAMPKDNLKQSRGVLAFPLLLLNLPSAAESLRSAVQAEAACLFSISHPGRLAAQWSEAKARILLLSHRLHRDHKKTLRSTTVVKEKKAQVQMHALLTNRDPMQHNGLLGSFLTSADLVFQAWEDQCSPLLEALRSLDHIFGDTSSFYLHSLKREHHAPFTLTSLNRPGRQEGEDPGTAILHTVQGKRKALQYATDFFSARSAIGVFRQRQVEEERQDDFLSNISRTLSEDQQVLAEGPDENGLLTEDELLLALNSTGRGACPGYDGLPYEFYRAFREDLVPLLLHIFNTAFLASTHPSSPSLSPLLCGVICLLPKPGQPQCELSGLRPITLLNCDSKLVLLMLSNRLQRPLDYLVDIAQSAFIHGRDISDNVRYHQGLRARLKELGTPAHLLLSDLTKAYDSVDRGLVLKAMTAQGFREQGIIRWVQLMSSGTSCTVRINGTFTPFFPTVSGLEQGSSLSCHKWVIVWQLFFAQLNKLQASGTLPTFTLPNGENAPPSLGYADDDNYILIGELSELALRIKRLFEEGATLGLPEQSTTKTFLLCLSDDTHPVLQTEGEHTINPPSCYPQLPQGKKAGLRHLGVPIFGLHDENCKQAFSKVPGTMHLEGLAWNCAQPNKLGRTHISVLNLASKAIYQAAFHKPPANLVAAMQQQVNRFVAKPSCPTEDSPIPTHLYPSPNICFLPKKGPQTEDCSWEALPTGAMIPYSGEVTNLATPPRAALVQYYPKPAYAWSREDWNFHKAQQNLAVAD